VKLFPIILPAALLTVCMSLGCRGVDYDIAEVASTDYLGLDEEHDQEHPPEGDHQETASTNPHPFYDSSYLCVNPNPPGEELMEEVESSGVCLHDAGERNHGTGWFFNQPWAATFIWSKIVRDTVILLVLAAVVFLVSDRTLSQRRRR
jgi:hypothetical protein